MVTHYCVVGGLDMLYIHVVLRKHSSNFSKNINQMHAPGFKRNIEGMFLCYW